MASSPKDQPDIDIEEGMDRVRTKTYVRVKQPWCAKTNSLYIKLNDALDEMGKGDQTQQKTAEKRFEQALQELGAVAGIKPAQPNEESWQDDEAVSKGPRKSERLSSQQKKNYTEEAEGQDEDEDMDEILDIDGDEENDGDEKDDGDEDS